MSTPMPGNVFLYIDFQDRRAGGNAEQALSYLERHELSGIIAKHGGSVIESVSSKLVAGFVRANDALDCARILSAAAIKIRNSDPQRRNVAHRILLDYRMATADKRLQTNIAEHLSWHLPAVPPNSIVALKDFVDRVPGISPTPRLLALTQANVTANAKARSRMFLLAGERAYTEEEEETRAGSIMSVAALGLFSEIELRAGGRARKLHPTDCPISIGRSKTCGFSVNVDLASRVHGTLSFENDKFTYTDASKNGSFVTLPGGEEVHLQGEKVVLAGEGYISLGAPRTKQPGDVIQYICRATKLGFDEPVTDRSPSLVQDEDDATHRLPKKR
ncbi:MAG TPA: FHA domain-containing protein [Nevskiaceae bacterium]|nr:FHA domain-containing protein [Nevskiaceae bacterium]